MTSYATKPQSWIPAFAGMTERFVSYYVYIMASEAFGTIYIGVTRDIIKRVWEHKNHVVEGFTKKHDCTTLVYYEVHDSIEAAILREKQMKEWKRNWKIRLIMESNPNWHDLYDSITK